MRARRPVAGPASWTIPISAPPASTTRAAGSSGPHAGPVDVAVDGVDGRAERLQQLEHLDRDEVAGVEDRVGGAHPLHARGGQRPAAAGHVRVADDGQAHGGVGPPQSLGRREERARGGIRTLPTSASGGQRSIH